MSLSARDAVEIDKITSRRDKETTPFLSVVILLVRVMIVSLLVILVSWDSPASTWSSSLLIVAQGGEHQLELHALGAR